LLAAEEVILKPSMGNSSLENVLLCGLTQNGTF
jgi:hypothetical protein